MTVSQQIIDVLNVLCEKFGIVIDWTGENVIPYLEVLGSRVVSYVIGTSWVWMALGILMFIIMLVAAGVCIKGCSLERNEYDKIDWIFTGCIVCIPLFILSIGIILTQTFDIIRAYTIPELTIIDFIRPYLQ